MGVNPALDDFVDVARDMHHDALDAARDAGRALATPRAA